MSKTRSLLAGLKAAINPTAAPDWSAKIAAAERQYADAESAHGRAALDAQRELPDAAGRLVRAQEALQAAQTHRETIQAARRAWEAQETERDASAAAAEAERQDKAALAAFDHLTAVAKEGEPILAAYDAWWVKMLAADAACRPHFTLNSRVRADLAVYSLADLVSREIARRASTKPLPPGANVLAAEVSDRRAWVPLAEYFAALANAILPRATKGKVRAA